MKKKVLVIGATGAQGLPTVKNLLKAGFIVRGFTLDYDPRIIELENMGVEMFRGSLFDENSVYAAMKGINIVVFISVLPTANDPVPEITIGKNVIFAAEKAGIEYMIHTSVDRAGDQEHFKRWGYDFWTSLRMYWIGKSTVINLIKASHIRHWTILKPAYMMDCFIPPKAIGMYPQMKDGKLVSARLPETKLTMMNCDDIGMVVADACREFDKYEHKEIPLAGDALTMDEIADTISKVTGRRVEAVSKTREELLADKELVVSLQKMFGGNDETLSTNGNILSTSIDTNEWENMDGYTADIAYANSFGVKLSTFKEWCERHKGEFVFD